MVDLNFYNGNVLVINDSGENLGNMPVKQAKQVAFDSGLDLIVVSSNDTTPVCKIIDKNKWQFEQKKKAKAHKQKPLDMKQIRFSINTDEHDLVIKSSQIEKFIEKGHHVRLFVKLKNREKSRPDVAVEKLEHIISLLKTTVHVDKMNKAPNVVSVIISPV